MKFSRRKFLSLSGIGLASVSSAEPGFDLSPIPAQLTQNLKNHESWVELDLKKMRVNLDKIRKRVKVPILAVIKANAYGHGLERIGACLDELGIAGLMVCKLQEAIALRKAGVSCPILNFGPLDSDNADVILKHNLTQFLSTENHQALNQAALRANKRADVHIHIDTGMNRVGIPYAKASAIIPRLASQKGLNIKGISTTLTEDEEFDKEQISRLGAIFQKAKQAGIDLGKRHAASSAGIFGSSAFLLDMIRPGICLYGYYPNQKTSLENSLSLQPVLEFKTRVSEVKSLNPGDSVSYLRRFKVKTKQRMALLPVGYSDGYPPNVANIGQVLIGGKKHPIIASITANHMEVSLGLESSVQPGDEAVLIGTQGREKITADDIANWAQSSNYKVLIGLNPLIPRFVK